MKLLPLCLTALVVCVSVRPSSKCTLFLPLCYHKMLITNNYIFVASYGLDVYALTTTVSFFAILLWEKSWVAKTLAKQKLEHAYFIAMDFYFRCLFFTSRLTLSWSRFFLLESFFGRTSHFHILELCCS